MAAAEDGPPPAHRFTGRERRILLLAWLAAGALAVGPEWLAERKPPPGRAFPGAFFFQDDYHQHLSFAEQATRGHLVFYNKFDLRPHEPFLVNLTWGAGGLLGRLTGGDAEDGMRLAHLLGLGGLVLGGALVLRLGGVREGGLGWGLLLLLAGGGLGWLRRLLEGPDAWTPDLGTSLFPMMQAASGPHGVVGTALILVAFARFVEWRARGGRRWPWLVAAGLLGVTRPFELVLFLFVVLLLMAHDLARGKGRAALAPGWECLWLLPMLLYDVVVFRFHPAFGAYGGGQNTVIKPPVAELFWAVLPALALAGMGLARRPRSGAGREMVAVLLAAAAAVILLLAMPWFPFALQFVSTLGPVLLLLAGILTAARWRPVAALALAPTSFLILVRLFHPSEEWFTSADNMAAARALAGTCRPHDVVLAPEEPSLIFSGLTPCSVVHGHRVLTPDPWRRAAEVRAFYRPETHPYWRAGYLHHLRARFVVLPPRGRVLLPRDMPLSPVFAGSGLEVWDTGSGRGFDPGAAGP
ncbi:MAG TPA: hypothetical protein VII13_01195 [Vicinamibacteria bacterium]